MIRLDGNQLDVVVVGAGAAGIAAARRLGEAGRVVQLVESRSRIGGRAHTVHRRGLPLDLGCGWLHSADDNPLVAEAQALGLTIDRSAPPWSKRATTRNFSGAEQTEFRAAQEAFHERLAVVARGIDRPASESLDPECKWNPLLDAVSQYVNGVSLRELSTLDFERYHDTGVNWRISGGYGSFFERWAHDLPIVLDCPTRRINHNGRRVRVETDRGSFECAAAIVAAPTDVLASGSIVFSPEISDHLQAAHNLPLGVDEKVYLALDQADDFAPDTRLFGSTNQARTGAYALRPMGLATVECFFGGDLARELARAGTEAFADFAIEEIVAALGSGMRSRLTPLASSSWTQDPWSRGAYSYARIGCADARAVLARPASPRLVFAGEACSPHYFSTAHGAAESGRRAADLILEGGAL